MSDNSNIHRLEPNYKQGLSEQQVQEHIAQGLINTSKSGATKSYWQIFKSNFFTFFNMLNIVLATLLIAVGAYKDLIFILIVVTNFIIGIVQEITSKKTLDKLALIVAQKARVVRGGQQKTIEVHEIVLDDVMNLKTGDQICADSTLLHGYLEVDESLISGESVTVVKEAGDFLYSGSFIVSGQAYAKVEHVGEDNYADRLSSIAKTFKQKKSQLYRSLNIILKSISFIIIPLGILLYYKQNVVLGLLPQDAIVKTVAGLIGMIPEGLVLLTSIALVTSTVLLALKKTLVQDLYSIETLARVDMLCLDKTGTLTEGELVYHDATLVEEFDLAQTMSRICGALSDENATITALRTQFPPIQDNTLIRTIPFSSARKYSGAVFADGTYLMGATEFIFSDAQNPLHAKCRKQANDISGEGKRVLVLAHTPATPMQNEVPSDIAPLAWLTLTDEIRPDAASTLRYFYDQDVHIKIISGDHPMTVSLVAARAGVHGAENFVDASTLTTEEELSSAVAEYTVFGRVSPQQKQSMVAALKAQGHTVAMMGDGINDVPALKESDCSIAVASGSDAAKNISSFVLLDSNFASLPGAVKEGRKVINNIQRVATLFITKTVYSFLLTLATLFLFASAYPFTPLQLTMVSFINIGLPSFVLALEPNYARIEGNFLQNVLSRSLPGGLSIFFNIWFINAMAGPFSYSQNAIATMCLYIVVAGGLWVLLNVSRPLTLMRKILFFSMIGLFAVVAVFFNGFFEINPIDAGEAITVIIMVVLMPFVMKGMEWLLHQFFALINSKWSRNKMVKKMNDLRDRVLQEENDHKN